MYELDSCRLDAQMFANRMFANAILQNGKLHQPTFYEWQSLIYVCIKI